MLNLKSLLAILLPLVIVIGTSNAENSNDTLGTSGFISSLKTYAYSKPDSILPLLDSVTADLETYGLSKSLCKAYILKGNIQMHLQQYDAALEYFNKKNCKWVKR